MKVRAVLQRIGRSQSAVIAVVIVVLAAAMPMPMSAVSAAP